MDDNISADQFYASIGMARPKISPGEKISITEIATRLMAFLQRTGRGPFTLLLPDDDKLDGLELDTDHLDQAALDGIMGWFLDLVLFGNALSTGTSPSTGPQGKFQVSTIGGSSMTVSYEDGRPLVVDPWGVRAVVSEPLLKTPVVTLHAVDELIMFAAWKDQILPDQASL